MYSSFNFINPGKIILALLRRYCKPDFRKGKIQLHLYPSEKNVLAVRMMALKKEERARLAHVVSLGL